MKKQLQQGLSLIELIVTVTVLTILVGIGVPQMNTFLKSARVNGEFNKIISALHLARTTSVERQMMVLICPTNAEQSKCTTDWDDAIAVSVIADEDDGIEKAVEVIMTLSPGSGSHLRKSTKNKVIYRRQGYVTQAATISICDSGSSSLEYSRELTVSKQGRIKKIDSPSKCTS